VLQRSLIIKMKFIATTGTDLHTFLVENQQINLVLTLKFRSKVKFENILKFFGYDFLYPVNTILQKISLLGVIVSEKK
jgi:hypothetical protein